MNEWKETLLENIGNVETVKMDQDDPGGGGAQGQHQ